MKYFILFFFISVVTAGKAQEVVNLILVGDKGVTENIMEANAFIAVKKYPTYFQRLDYNLHAPLKKVRNYTDSTLTVLEGNFYEYDVNGALKISGNYVNNLKDKDWYFYNDTGKVVLEEKYAQGILMTTVNPDTVTKEKSLEKNFVKVDQEKIKRIDINQCPLPALRKHPYIGYYTAKAIADYRVKHLKFRSVNEVSLLPGMTPEKFKQLSPYLIVIE